MRVRFWGTRGSLPTSLNAGAFQKKARALILDALAAGLADERAVDAWLGAALPPRAMTFGGNTPCIEVADGDDYLVFDCGTGLRELGLRILAENAVRGSRIDIFQTHVHWDHLLGFPFFAPAFTGTHEIHVHGAHPHLRERFEYQMDHVHFPITLDELRSPVVFEQLPAGEDTACGPFRVAHRSLHHPGGSYAYRISTGGKTVVLATDGEYRDRSDAGLAPFVEFYRGADLLIFDAMYATLERTIEKADYGHSTAVIGVDIALRAGVRTLALFHHDPESDDAQIVESCRHAREYLDSLRDRFPGNELRIVTAYDGMELGV